MLFLTAAVMSVALVFAFMPNDPSTQGLLFDGGNQFLATEFSSSGTRYFSSVR